MAEYTASQKENSDKCECGGNLVQVNFDDMLNELKCLCLECRERRMKMNSKSTHNCPWCTLPHEGKCQKAHRDFVKGKRQKGKNKPFKEDVNRCR
jgi:uncharacterized CHY-type Zn-finger protein